MDQTYINKYYDEQAGSGISGFEGIQYQHQKGSGFFGRILKGIGLPLVRYFGRQALETGKNIASDVLGGVNIKRAGKKRLRETMESMTGDAKRKLLGALNQTGSGLSAPSVLKKRSRRLPRKKAKRLLKGIKRKRRCKKKPVKKSSKRRKTIRKRKKKRVSFLS